MAVLFRQGPRLGMCHALSRSLPLSLALFRALSFSRTRYISLSHIRSLTPFHPRRGPHPTRRVFRRCLNLCIVLHISLYSIHVVTTIFGDQRALSNETKVESGTSQSRSGTSVKFSISGKQHSGYLAYKKLCYQTHSPRTLQWAYAQGPIVILRGGGVFL